MRLARALTLCLAAALLGLGGLAGTAGRAQDLGLPESAILVVDPNRLFNETLFGKRVASEIEADSAVLAAENRQIEAELTEEEKALTESRPSMTPEAFRAAADSFDEKVQRIRSEQEAKARALAEESETAQRRFLGAARPVLEALMRESGASVLLDTRGVLLTSDVVDVTEEAVQRIDEAIGDGGGAALPDPALEQPAPDPVPAPTVPAPVENE